MRRTLRVVGFVLLFWLCAEVVLRAYARRFPELTSRSPYTYVPYVDHVVNQRHPDTPDGFRPVHDPVAAAESVWVFGGSTVHGATDTISNVPCEPARSCSIPSHLSDALRRRGLRLRVFNFGQLNYGSTQERILFEELLAARPAPRVAVFVDGTNDIETQAGIAGYPNEYDQLRARMAGGSGVPFGVGLRRARFAVPYALDALFNGRLPLWREPGLNPFGRPDRSAPGQAYRAAVVNGLAHNTRLRQAVCDRFGVRCVFVLQPHGLEKAHPSPEEVSAGCAGDGRWHREMSDLMASSLRALPGATLVDLRDVFADTRARLFYDCVHVLDASPANAMIAAALADAVAAEVAH